ncbi:TetR/AcrR family transcriptional regulator C-terminal domain-containing protein [Nocardioides sp.]|uniref:TetR/AcrR family transcriptional regulator C-terminal domain-containing protein n=1 Tax=Nocardioides sp. TaxID=35761 RepID=UPI0027264FBC|nr:TetR/AcrR family transcriptional regulator C-terminal domain-containing protein [Nocardioides sp.]MDO9455680.1 TetR/AcrR family transcriptional regulator C-terminal domain-containing protein [Nocardioides sp.]
MTDPDPMLPLLWRGLVDQPAAAPKRGPKQKVSVDEVVDAGVEVADTEGLAALSMRGLAQRLGLGAMSLYTYVPGRDELVVLMVDQVLGRGDRPTLPADVRRRLELVAETALADYLAHPWLLEVAGLRAWLGPHAADRYEWQLTAVDGLGLGDVEMDQTVALLDGIAATTARAVQEVRAAERRSGLTELQWWEANADALGEAMAGRDYPLAGRVGQAAGELYQAATDPDRQFRFGLARIVDGLLVHLDREKSR